MLLPRVRWSLLLLPAVLAMLCGAAPAAPAPAAGALPPILSFFSHSSFGGALLSPDAKFLAARVSAKGQRDFLAVIDLATNAATVVAAYDDADVADYQWVNPQRLVFNVTDDRAGQGNAMYAPGLYAVNRDGTQLVQLADRGYAKKGATKAGRPLLPWHTYMLGQRGAQDSEFIYVRDATRDTAGELSNVGLLRLNSLTGQSQMVAGPGAVDSWKLDAKGEPRLAYGTRKDTTTIYYRDPAGGAWRTLLSYGAYNGGRDAVEPIAFGPDGTLYVIASGGKDTKAVHALNAATGKMDPLPLISTAGYDFDGNLIFSRDKLLGARFTTDAESTVWFDPAMKAVQEAIDAALPATVNVVSVAQRPEAPWVLVKSYSDVIPPTYSLYNTQTRQVNQVGQAHPAINSAQMGRQQSLRFKARDGLEIPVLLTLPAGRERKNLPLVVLVHGGPWVRGSAWGWHPDSQFLASRGYAVLEPSFRGTTGFGTAHELAGWKQWGLAMQNDVADATRWAIAQGVADPKRICIAGASYGGYATLMGLINDPDLYKCGIDWVGVTDINLMYNPGWTYRSDFSSQWKQYGMPEKVGDPVKDAAQLKATSPIEQAARITQPLLLAYGGSDVRVPLSHGLKFYDAVKRTNANVEWVEYPEEGHGFRLPRNLVDFWHRVELFLDKNIGKP